MASINKYRQYKYNVNRSTSTKIVDIERVDYSQVDSEFRFLTDLIFFTNRKDIDVNKFEALLKSKFNLHFKYFKDRFEKSSKIFWDKDFWNNRLKLFLSINDKKINHFLYVKIEKNFYNLLSHKNYIDVDSDINYIQYIELCNIKKENNWGLKTFKNNFIVIGNHLPIKKALFLIKKVVPIIFDSYDEYIESLFSYVHISTNNLNILSSLQQEGIIFDRKALYTLTATMINEHLNTSRGRGRRSLYELISYPDVKDYLKSNWNEQIRNNLIQIIRLGTFNELDEKNFKYMRIIFALDYSLLDDMVYIYLDKMYNERLFIHKKASVDRICKLLKVIPQTSSKKILSWLSTNNLNADIKFLIQKYPDLQKLSIFV